MLLRRFVAPNGKLYAFNRNEPGHKVFSAAPEKLFVGKHLYTETDSTGQKSDWLEKHFAKLEGTTNPIIEKIVSAVRSGKMPGLTRNEKALLDLFLYYQWKRVPDFETSLDIFADFEDVLGRAVEKFERTCRALRGDERANLKNPETLARIKQSAKLKSLADPGQNVQQLLSRKGLAIAVIGRPNKSFIIGSQPVAKFTLPGRAHLSDPTVEIWLPIAHDVAITPAPQRGNETIAVIRDDKLIRHINTGICGQSTIIAGRSEALIKSLANMR